jgi:Mannosyltransferase (PIG-V)
MSIGSISAPRLRDLRVPLRLDGVAVRDVRSAFISSRLLVLVVGAITAATASFGNRVWRAPIPAPFLHPFGSWPLGGVFDSILSPFVRGDATYFSAIAYNGYHHTIETSFFPGYPLLVRFLGGFASPAATVLVGSLVSLATFACALYVLHRLTTLELGERPARATLLLIAFCPAAVFFSSPYTESLFLFLSVAAFYAARTERWGLAALLAAAAALTRNIGVLLMIPLAIFYLQARSGRWSARAPLRALSEFRPDRRLLWLLVIPVGPIVYSVYLHGAFGDWLSWVHSQTLWGRQSAAPWNTVIDALRAGWHALRGHSGYYGGELVDLAFLAFAGLLVIASFRRLPLAYGLYSVAILLPAFADPILAQPPEPLHGLPRYVLVAFPLFMAGGHWSAQRDRLRWVLPVSALGLIGMTAAFAAWLPYY